MPDAASALATQKARVRNELGLNFSDRHGGLFLRVKGADGLIIAAAEYGRCETILSEDLNTGQFYHGIKVENPFRNL